MNVNIKTVFFVICVFFATFVFATVVLSGLIDKNPDYVVWPLLFALGVALVFWKVISSVPDAPEMPTSSPKEHPVKKRLNGHLNCPMYTRDVCLTVYGRPYRLISLDYESVKLRKVYVPDRGRVEIVAITDEGLPVCYLSDIYREMVMDILPYFDKGYIINFYTDREGYDMSVTIDAHFLEEPTTDDVTLPDNYVEEYMKTDTYTALDEIEAEQYGDCDYWEEQAEFEEFTEQLEKEREHKAREKSWAYWFGVGLGGGIGSSSK